MSVGKMCPLRMQHKEAPWLRELMHVMCKKDRADPTNSPSWQYQRLCSACNGTDSHLLPGRRKGRQRATSPEWSLF